MLAKHRKQEEATGMNDCKTVEQIREHLLKYTKDKGEVGRDNSWGYGVIDVEKLIKGGDTEEPKDEDPVKEEPKDEEPVKEEPVKEEPKDEEPPLPTPPSPPPVEEPIEEEPIEEEPIEDPVEEEPAETPKKKKNTLFIVLGVVVVATIIGIALVMNNKVDIPTPPYFDENGEVNWDEKFKFDKGNR
jgi:hypothetical protein